MLTAIGAAGAAGAADDADAERAPPGSDENDEAYLSALLDVPASTLSFHLKALQTAGLVTQVRDGRHLIYRPSLARMNALLAYLTDHCCQGEGGCGPVRVALPAPVRAAKTSA
jgi:DNA-binding transcriptional ArsR family regulator